MSPANFSNLIIRIRSNLYPGVDRINYLMSVELTDPIEDNQVKILVYITRNDAYLNFLLSRS